MEQAMAARKKSEQGEKRTRHVAFRCREEFGKWLDRFAEDESLDVTDIIVLALRHYGRLKKRPAAPRR
jgi:hypothetical protein